jgi:hypothetical protein
MSVTRLWLLAVRRLHLQGGREFTPLFREASKRRAVSKTDMDISSRTLDTRSIFQCDIIHIMLISLFPGYYAVGAEVTLATISSSAVINIGALNLSYKTQ